MNPTGLAITVALALFCVVTSMPVYHRRDYLAPPLTQSPQTTAPVTDPAASSSGSSENDVQNKGLFGWIVEGFMKIFHIGGAAKAKAFKKAVSIVDTVRASTASLPAQKSFSLLTAKEKETMLGASQKVITAGKAKFELLKNGPTKEKKATLFGAPGEGTAAPNDQVLRSGYYPGLL